MSPPERLAGVTPQAYSKGPTLGKAGYEIPPFEASCSSLLGTMSREADLDPPRRDLRVFLLAHEVDHGRADVGVSCELPHLVHRGAVPDRVVDDGLPQRVNTDAPASQPFGVDTGRLAVFLDQPPGGLAVEVPPDQTSPIRRHRPKEATFLVVMDAGPLHVGKDGTGR